MNPIIAMKQSSRHFDDLNIPHNPTLREGLEAAYWTAVGVAGQRKWSERIADSGELLMLEYAEQLLILDAIDEGFIKSILARNNEITKT